MGTLADSEDSDEMPYEEVIHQGLTLYCLLRRNQSSEKEKHVHFFEIITCDPLLYIMDHPDLTDSNICYGNSICS